MNTTPDISPTFRPPGKPVDVRKILARHRPFMIAAAFALAGLVAIEAWGTAQFAPPRAASEQWLWGGGAVLLALVGNWLGLVLAPRFVVPEKFPRPVGAFAQAAAYGIALTLLTFVVVFFMLLALASFELKSAVNLLKDLYVYALVAVVLFHALLYYVRQMHWLYEEFGGADSPLKPIAASGGLAVLIVVVTLALLPLDLQTIPNAPAAQRDLVALFIYGRDLYLLTLALGAYAWHLRWIADH